MVRGVAGVYGVKAGAALARTVFLVVAAWALARVGAAAARTQGASSVAEDSHREVRGITISCQTYGPEWGSDGFGEELDELLELGVNWVAIHPYARIRGDGSVESSLDPADPPRWLTRPIEEARARGIAFFVKPHLAYWGSPFRWRGAIDFDDPAELERFFASYEDWILRVAQVMGGAEAFCVGTELDRLTEHEAFWRRVIAGVRQRSDAHLTYAANWDSWQQVAFWDDLDAIGVQAYFPLVAEGVVEPTRAALLEGWARTLAPLRARSEDLGIPVVFTELGYDASTAAAVRPWERARNGDGGGAARALQRDLFEVGLSVLERERSWLRGAFLWKWFVGATRGEDFLVDSPTVREVLKGAWGR